MREQDSFRQIPVDIADRLIGIGSMLILFFGAMPDVARFVGRFM